MQKQKLLKIISILMLLSALPLAWLSFLLTEQPEYIAAEQGISQLPEHYSRRQLGRMIGAALYLLSFGAGITGLMGHKKGNYAASRVMAWLLTVGGLMSIFLLGEVFLLTMLPLTAETLLYWIGIKKTSKGNET